MRILLPRLVNRVVRMRPVEIQPTQYNRFSFRRMFDVNQLKAVRIGKRFDGLRETHFVLPDVLDFFFEIPFEFNRVEHTTLDRHRTR